LSQTWNSCVRCRSQSSKPPHSFGRPGGNIIARQYFGFKDWDKEGKAPAWMEVVRATGLKFRFVSYNLRKKYEPTITTNQ